jgi:hypothetical protein
MWMRTPLKTGMDHCSNHFRLWMKRLTPQVKELEQLV